MNAIRVIAILLLLGGVAGLTYGGFTYTRESQQAQIGPLELTVSDRQRVNIPSLGRSGCPGGRHPPIARAQRMTREPATAGYEEGKTA